MCSGSSPGNRSLSSNDQRSPPRIRSVSCPQSGPQHLSSPSSLLCPWPSPLTWASILGLRGSKNKSFNHASRQQSPSPGAGSLPAAAAAVRFFGAMMLPKGYQTAIQTKKNLRKRNLKEAPMHISSKSQVQFAGRRTRTNTRRR